MCGIAGVVQFGRETEHVTTVVRQMTDCLGHRGPDDVGVVRLSCGAFGHRRLAIIDVVHGRQPMQRVIGEKSYTIVYNGELYNTAALREELERLGYRLETASDTEVVLLSYVAWGKACAERLDGIFAFAVWDEAAGCLMLFRDRLGVKPLFYAEVASGIVFGSEMKTLFVHPEVEPVVTEGSLGQMLAFGPMRVPGETVFKAVREVLPGERVTVEESDVRRAFYWRLPRESLALSVEETIDEVRRLVEEAVVKQLVSDVPLCTFLSGGVDSSILTSVASKHLAERGERLQTFSVEYEGNGQYFEANAFQPAEDRAFIAEMCKVLPIEHTEITIKQEELAEKLWTALYLKDYPSMVDIDSSLYLFCREVKAGYKVALSGECADELFGGYPWFLEETGTFPWVRGLSMRHGLLNGFWRERFDYERIVREAYEGAMLSFAEVHAEEEGLQREQEMSYINIYYFMQTLLERKDRMSMGAGLEVRVPFADHRLVELLWRIPHRIKRLGGVEKGLLREAMKDYLPTMVRARKKSPYPKTMHPLYKKLVAEMLQEVLADTGSVLHQLFDLERLSELLKANSEMQVPWFGQLMAQPQLMAYLVQLDGWFRRYGVRVTS